VPINKYPNVTISEYGRLEGVSQMKAEVYQRGPIVVYLNAEPLVAYKGGIFDDTTAG
jgi:cathepsin X